jgi:hypothetical protein
MPNPRAEKIPAADLSARASKAKFPGFESQRWMIDYHAVLKATPGNDVTQYATFLAEELPYLWRDTYVDLSVRPTNLLRVGDEGFAYIFDWYSALVDPIAFAADKANEDRLVGACGVSRRAGTTRNVSRQRGWIGPTEKYLGTDRDKGHFVPHSLGGGLEINLFVQLRELNRGWSPGGRLYRSMERYCQQHSGTFFFNRPIYADGTAQPALLEFGLLKADGELWVERFPN